MSSVEMQIGKKLKELRIDYGLTQQQIADAVGIPRVNYTRYENGTSHPDYDTLVRLADFFDISLDYFFERSKFF